MTSPAAIPVVRPAGLVAAFPMNTLNRGRMLRRGSRTWRFVAPVVAVMQLAAVTFVPVVHPFLHDRSGGEATVMGPSLTPPSDAQDGLRSEDMCVACLASPGVAVPHDLEPVACSAVSHCRLPGPSDRDVPVILIRSANRVRAPPLA
jgi:hypothetical protein